MDTANRAAYRHSWSHTLFVVSWSKAASFIIFRRGFYRMKSHRKTNLSLLNASTTVMFIQSKTTLKKQQYIISQVASQHALLSDPIIINMVKDRSPMNAVATCSLDHALQVTLRKAPKPRRNKDWNCNPEKRRFMMLQSAGYIYR
jgi:hypothetical protein